MKSLVKRLTDRVFTPDKSVREAYSIFLDVLEHDRQALTLLSEMEMAAHAPYVMDAACIPEQARELGQAVVRLARSLRDLAPGRYPGIVAKAASLARELGNLATLPCSGDSASPPYTLDLSDIRAASRLAGGKAEHVARLTRDLDLPVPEGFVITTNAFAAFIEENGLRKPVDEMLAKMHLMDRPRDVAGLANNLQKMILRGHVPSAILEDIEERVSRMVEVFGEGVTFAVRSSAFGEDGQVSFAGQYETVLDVASDDIEWAYKTVLASKYCSKAISYRIRHGLLDCQTPMASLVMRMIDTDIGGVLYTLDPAEPEKNRMALFSVPGHGEILVDGGARADVLFFDRKTRAELECRLDAENGPDHLSCLPARSDREILLEYGMALEAYFGEPQDVEWCRDRSGHLYILQSRPVHLADKTQNYEEELDRLPTVASGLETISPGVGAGKAVLLGTRANADDVPPGSVLFAPTLSPQLAGALERLSAVCAQTGSRASHFASVAREFGLPVAILPRECSLTSHAVQALLGHEVVLDASRGILFNGSLPKNVVKTAERDSDVAFSRHLATLLQFASPLTLTDPTAENFTVDHITSPHDAIRFCHEKAVNEMTGLGERAGRGIRKSKRLVSSIPLSLYLLDLDDGIRAESASAKHLVPEDIVSRPMHMLWQGLTHKDIVWPSKLDHLDWTEFDRVSAGFIDRKALSSLALVASEYVHLLVRFGYHFAVVDALIRSENDESEQTNYIFFRFKGGGADYDKRLLRLHFMQLILERMGFALTTCSDMLQANLSRQPAPVCFDALYVLGALLGVTRLMDMGMTNEADSEAQAVDFWERYAQPRFGAGV